MKRKLFIRKFHRWFSIIIGIQILFWMVSGAYFTLVPLKKVRGEDRMQPVTYTPLPTAEFMAPGQVLAMYEGITELRLTHSGDEIVYACFLNSERPQFLVDAVSGEKLSHKTRVQIQHFVSKDSGVEVQTDQIHLLETRPPEYKGPLPVYQAELGDSRKTHLYLSPITGEVISRRNRYWRIFDFLWMLHIMDFKERSNFNNNLVRTLSLVSLSVVASGYLLYMTSRKKKKSGNRTPTVEP